MLATRVLLSLLLTRRGRAARGHGQAHSAALIAARASAEPGTKRGRFVRIRDLEARNDWRNLWDSAQHYRRVAAQLTQLKCPAWGQQVGEAKRTKAQQAAGPLPDPGYACRYASKAS